MEMGEIICCWKYGVKALEGRKELVFKTKTKAINDFVYSANVMKKVKEVYQ